MNPIRIGMLLGLGALLAGAQDLRDYARKVTEFTLPNGLHFLIMERHQVPVVSFHTYVNAGAANDPAGQKGMARLMERLAFKGTDTIGTRNWTVEKKALEDLDDLFGKIQAERDKGPRADVGRIAAFEAEVSLAASAAADQGVPGEFTRIMQENGAVGINCRTTPDSIETSYSLPSNRTELWFLMESQRLSRPVFRDFYRERESLWIEINNMVESRAPAKLQESLLADAFESLPYRYPLMGWQSDVTTLQRSEALAFYNTYFVPGNITIAIAGDIDPANARQLAGRYFGDIPAKPVPPAAHTQEMAQLGPKSVTIWTEMQPRLLVAYKRPSENSRDDAALDAIQMILGEEQSGRLYRELVEQRGLAQEVSVNGTYPSGRNVNLFLFTIVPSPNHTNEENRKALEELLGRLQSTQVDAAALARVKNVMRGRITRVLSSNQQLAALLPYYYYAYGDWRRLFEAAARFDALKVEDVERVALQYFQPSGETVAYGGPRPGGRQ